MIARLRHTRPTCCELIALLATGMMGFSATHTWAAPVEPVLETIVVPSEYPNGPSGVMSSMVLDAGVTYYLLAEGTYSYAPGGPGFADAEWWYEPGQSGWQEDWSVYPELPLDNLDLVVDDVARNWMGHGDQNVNPLSKYGEFAEGVFSPSHAYWLPIVGDGSTINLRISDTAYGDNNGSLTVGIYAAPEPASLTLLVLSGFGLLKHRRRFHCM